MNTNFYQPRRSNVNSMLIIVFSLTGLGLLAVAFFFYQNTVNNIATKALATGRVVSIELHSEIDSGSYVPVVEFTSANGQSVRTTSFASQDISVSGDYQVGQTVEVYYDPNDPGDMFINDFMHTWFVAALFGGLGLCFVLTSVGIFVFSRMLRRMM